MSIYFDQNNKLAFNRYNYVLTDSTEITDTHALTLINRMIASGETPTVKRQSLINNCIVALKANNLFENQFDVLVTTKAHAIKSAKMNWIKDSNDAIDSATPPTFTTDVDYKSNGATSYLNTKYNPSSSSILYKQNDASFILKMNNVPAGGNPKFAAGAYDGGTSYLSLSDRNYNRINCNTYGGTTYVNGYNCLSRNVSTSFNQYQNSSTSTIGGMTSTALVNREVSILCLNYNLVFDYFLTNTTGIEMYALGKSMTQAQFLTFQTIMNDYFGNF